MSTTGGDLDLVKPQMTDTVEQTIPDIANNMQVIDDEFSAHVAESATQSQLGHVKLQETSINATLLNGWTGTLKYSKNSLGQVWLRGQLLAGTVSALTNIATLPVGYRQQHQIIIPIANASNGSYTGLALNLSSNGNLRTPATTLPTTGVFYEIDLLFQT